MLPVSWSLEQGYTQRQIRNLETLERFCRKATHMQKEDPRLPILMQKIDGRGAANLIWNENLPANNRLDALRQTFQGLQVIQLNQPAVHVAAKESSSSSSDSSEDGRPVVPSPIYSLPPGLLGPIYCVPEEIFSNIFSFLDPTSAAAASKVCHAWQPLNQSLLWKGGNGTIAISHYQTVISYFIDFLNGVHFPLEGQYSEQIEALQKLSEGLEKVPETLPQILYRKRTILNGIRKILSSIDSTYSSRTLQDLFSYSIMLSTSKKCLDGIELDEFVRALIIISKDNGYRLDFDVRFESENLSVERFAFTSHKLIQNSAADEFPIARRCMLQCWDKFQMIDEEDPQNLTRANVEQLLHCGSLKETWRLINHPNTPKTLCKMWNEELRTIVEEMVEVGDGENACWLANSQQPKLKSKLLQKIGTTYAKLNQPIHAEAIYKLLNTSNTKQEKKAQSQILKKLLLKEVDKGNFEEAILYF